jgi:hypothetical protein
MAKKKAKLKHPQTPAEWQEAVNQAHFWLLVDSARQYGLITGGPEVNLNRCEEILEKGKAQGIEPDPAGVEEIIKVAFKAVDKD